MRMLFGRTRSKSTAALEKAHSDEIDAGIERDRARKKREVNDVDVVILGSRNVREDFIRQLWLYHHKGLSEKTRITYRGAVFSTVIRLMWTMLRSFPSINCSFSAEDEVLRERILRLPAPTSGDTLPSTVKDDFAELWRHSEVRAKAESSTLPQSVIEHARHFLDSIDRIVTSEYVPTEEDIYRAHICQSGFYDTTLSGNHCLYRFWDGEAQRGERRKWLPMLADIKAVIFTVSLASYDELLDDNYHIYNRLRAALDEWESLCRESTLKNTPFILIMGNLDVFADKLSRKPLQDYFPDFTGGDDYDAACKFLLSQFTSLNRDWPTRYLISHFMDKSNVPVTQFILSTLQQRLTPLQMACF